MAKIVRIADMSDKEREEWEEQVKTRQEERETQRKERVEKANKAFEKAEKTKGIINDSRNVIGNLGYGLGSGLISFAQQVKRSSENQINNRNKLVDETNQKFGIKTKSINDILGDNANKSITEILTGVNPNEKLEEQKQINTTRIQENIDNTSNKILKKASELTPSIGQMLPGMLPGGTAYFTASAAGNYYDDAKQRGMSEEDASKYASIMGTSEGLLEAAGGALTKGIGKNLIKGQAKQAAKLYGLDLAENFIEEAVMEPLSEFTATKTGGEKTADWSNIGQRMLESGIDGALVSMIMGGASAGIGSSINIINKVAKGENISQAEIETAKNDIQAQESNNQVTKVNSQENTTQQESLPITNEQNRYSNKLREMATNEINNSSLSNNDKQEMLNALNNINEVTDADIQSIKLMINSITEIGNTSNQLETSDSFKNNEDRRKYVQYRNDNKSYDSTTVNEVLDITPANRNGNRTVKQWLQVADEIGKRISNKSNEEIERIAYKSWFDVQPTKSITQYDNQAKQKVAFQKLTSDEWINTINNAVNKSRGENITQTQQTIQEQNKMAENGLSKQLAVAKESNKYTNRIYEESARKYNIDINNETVKSINKVTQARGINARFDADVFTDNNANAIWRITTDANGNTTREVILNPNADTKKALQNIIIHELTHDIEGTAEYKELRDLILNYDEGNVGFENARKSLKEIYSKVYDINSDKFQSLVDNEAVADILGNKLGTQEFINTLTMEKPTTARKIYNWVIDKLNKINKLTGYSSEKIFWADVKNKFENAYRQDYQGNNNNLKYSIQTDNNGNKYVKVDTDQDIFEGILEKDYSKIAKMYMQDYLRGNTILSENDTATIGSKGINKYTNPKQQTKYISEKMQLTPELKNVLEIAEKVQDSPPTKDTSKYPNWEYYKFKFELGGKFFEGLINIGVDKNGNKNFYEINKIHTTSSSYVSTNKSSSTDSINNSITSQNKNVNTTKYSVQESEDNSGSFNLPLKDNQGRTLTKEQQEYFKDSKVRDENGSLKTMYHGSNNKFSVFKHGEAYRGSSKASVGYWFTETAEGAKNFANSVWYGDTKTGAKVYEVYLDIKNPKIYEGIDNTNELHKIDNEINNLKEIIRKLENKNIAIEINKQELRWANSKEELRDIAKYEGIDFEDAENYHNAIKQYNELIEEYDNKKYNDSYELFRADIYKIAGKSANEANIGGTGMYLNNEEEVVKQYVEDLKEQGYDGIIIKNTKFDNETLGKDNSQYVVFNSNQIKNVDNINPTENPDIRFSKENTTWQEYLDKNYKATGTRTNLQDIKLPTAPRQQVSSKEIAETSTWTEENRKKKNKKLNNVTNIEEPKTMDLPSNEEKSKQNKIAKILSEPVKNQKSAQRTWAILQANLIDKGAVFETLSLKTNNRELQAKYDATLSSSSKGQYAIGNARHTFENGKKTLQSKSLTSIIDEVGENANDFYNYMYHQLNIDRMTLEERFNGDTGINYERKNAIKNKPVFGEAITAEYSRQKVAEYEKKYPEFKSYARDVYDFLDANKKELVDSGVISQELSDKFKEMYPHYVPIARVDKNNNAIQVPLDTKRTGINNPIKKATGGSKDIQPMFHTIADRTLQTYRASARNAFGVELKNTLEKNNLLNATEENTDIDTIIDTMSDEQETGVKEGTQYKNPTFTVFENGKKVTYDINQDMYDALKPQNELITKINNSKASKVVNKISNIRRGVLTEYNLLFSLTNAIKDTQDVLQNSQHAIKTYSKFPEAYAQIMQKGYWYNEYIQNGGEQNSYFKDGNFSLDNSLTKAKKAITMPLRGISKVNNVIEMAPRLAEYIASRENGSSVATSMLDASRVTTNFKAGGDITKFANRNGFTFLNAGVQGMSQQIRNLREANAKGLKGYAVLAAKTILSGMPALILNNLIWEDDEDYDELQDYVKDSYYIVGKIGENQFIRIPKGRTTAVIQKLFTTADKYITDSREINIDNFAKDFWKNLVFAIDNIAPNNPIDNNIASPLVQVAKNETWYGEDLVPTRLQDVPKAEQYDETTDKFSKWLGQTLNISPMKINYLLDQYGGGVADVLLPLGTPQAENNPIEDKFTTNSIMKNKNPGEFYTKLDELKANSNSSKATDEDNLKYKYMSSISAEMSNLYKQKREIQNSSDDDKTKKEKIQKVQEQINELAKKGLKQVDELAVNKNTATIGAVQYYKTTNVKDGAETWKELSEEETEKNKNISLTTYASYKEKVAQETIKQRKSGNIKEDGSLKDKDKISILINSNYSDKEKQTLYENYIKSDKDVKYDIIKTTGLNINSYLKYKLAESNKEFAADKIDDGTVKEKSVSGSAKTKRLNYINSISGTTYTQRVILYALEYEPNRAEKQQVINYVKALPNKTNQEKLDILSNFKGVTIYKDGTFEY